MGTAVAGMIRAQGRIYRIGILRFFSLLSCVSSSTAMNSELY